MVKGHLVFWSAKGVRGNKKLEGLMREIPQDQPAVFSLHHTNASIYLDIEKEHAKRILLHPSDRHLILVL